MKRKISELYNLLKEYVNDSDSSSDDDTDRDIENDKKINKECARLDYQYNVVNKSNKKTCKLLESNAHNNKDFIKCASCNKIINEHQIAIRKNGEYGNICKACQYRNRMNYYKEKRAKINNNNISNQLHDSIIIGNNNTNKYVSCSSCHMMYHISIMGINMKSNKPYSTCPTCRISKANKYNNNKKYGKNKVDGRSLAEILPEGMNRCSYCGEIRKYEEMGIYNKTNDLFSKCIECRRKDKNNRYLNQNKVVKGNA